jgi:PAS domain S-box-containing protein
VSGSAQAASGALAAALVNHARDALIAVSTSGEVLAWNRAAERLFGHDGAAAVGQAVAPLIAAPSLHDEIRRRMNEAIDAGSSAFTYAMQRPGAASIPVDVAMSAVRATADRTEIVILDARDVSEIEHLREGRAADAHFKDLIEAAPDAKVIVGADGLIVLVNAQTERLFGYAREELLGKSMEVLVPERFRAIHPEHRGGYMSAPRPRLMGEGLELHGRRKDGSEFPAEISLSPLRLARGTLFTAAIRDVTGRKQTELALIIANRELEAFSSSVAHDLRAPLRGMSGFAQILLDDYADKLDAEGVDCLREIHFNAGRMGALIDALLSLSRVARTELKPSSVSLTELARASVAAHRAADPTREIEVVIQPDLVVDLDPVLARNLIDNLLANAWKFTGKVASPRIEVGVADDGSGRAFFVRDNGAGFDMAYADKLFAPFQRLHTVGEFPGTGIGLATAQRILHRHGGRIWADGHVGSGATFHFTVPLQARGGSK